MKPAPQSSPKSKAGVFLKSLAKQWDLQAMALPAVICMVLFSFVPLLGLQIAFKDYQHNLGIWGSKWAGLKHFEAFVRDPLIGGVLLNTIGLSVIKAFITFPLPIIFALMLSEIRCNPFKKAIQTVSYFPYFISWSIVALLATNWLSPSSGFINSFLVSVGILNEPYYFLGKPEAFWGVSVGLDIWKNIGYSSIIYLAAITGVDQEVVEAAVIDGAGRLRRIWNVTLPAILPTIMILLIINVGSLLKGGSNFDISYNLSNPLNLSRSEIIDTYVLKIGLAQSRFSYATAVGLLQSLVSTVLLVAANTISKWLTKESYF